MTPIGWREFPTIFWSVDLACVSLQMKLINPIRFISVHKSQVLTMYIFPKRFYILSLTSSIGPSYWQLLSNLMLALFNWECQFSSWCGHRWYKKCFDTLMTLLLGTSKYNSRDQHVHKGIHSVWKNGSLTIYGCPICFEYNFRKKRFKILWSHSLGFKKLEYIYFLSIIYLKPKSHGDFNLFYFWRDFIVNQCWQ